MERRLVGLNTLALSGRLRSSGTRDMAFAHLVVVAAGRRP